MTLRFLPAIALLAACGASAQPGNEPATAPQANAAAPAESPAIGTDRAATGNYSLVGQREAASALELRPDGRFRYVLVYGSLDQRAEGRWSSDGRRVMLNTEPRPRPAEFAMGAPTRSDEAPLVVFVVGPNGNGLAQVDVRIGLADGRVLEGYTQDYGWQLPAADAPGTVQWIELGLEAYGIPARRFAVLATTGNQFNFTFTPNDFGVVDFRDQMFAIEGRNLVIREDDGALTYSRDE